jgi:hypothetical protein
VIKNNLTRIFSSAHLTPAIDDDGPEQSVPVSFSPRGPHFESPLWRAPTRFAPRIGKPGIHPLIGSTSFCDAGRVVKASRFVAKDFSGRSRERQGPTLDAQQNCSG